MQKIVDVDGSYDGKTEWPAWFYGPEGQSQIFNSEEEVPEGWHDHPQKLEKEERRKSASKQDKPESPYKDKSDAEVVAELKNRKIDHNERWPRPKLEALLVEDDKKKAK